MGLVRGLIAQIVGTALGMGLVVANRALMGLQPWKAEPVVVVGAIVGVLTFLIGVGSFRDWAKWTRGEEAPLHHGPPPDKPAWTRESQAGTGQTSFPVRVTLSGLGWVGTLACLVPFVILGALWLRGSLRQRSGQQAACE